MESSAVCVRDSGDIFSAEHTMHILQLQQGSLRCSGFVSGGLAHPKIGENAEM